MILVTGATGFIGRHLVSTLAARGFQLRIAIRHTDSISSLPERVEAVVVGDLRQPVQWGPALARVRTIIHLAGRAHVLLRRDPQEGGLYWAVNALATRVLAESAVDEGVNRLVFISSSRAIGDKTPVGQRWHEETPCDPRDAYGQSKLEAERALQAVSRRSGLQVVILRPPAVYGAGVTASIRKLFNLIYNGIPLPFGLVRNRFSLLYVGNLVDAIQRVIEAPKAAAEIFHVADGEDVSTPDLAQRIGRALGRPARLLPVPSVILRLAGRAGDLLEKAVRINFPLNSENVLRLLSSVSLDTTKIRRELGWDPPWGMDAGLAHTAQWFHETRHQRRPCT